MGRTRIIRLSEIDWTLLTSIDPAHIQFINSSISLKAAIKPGCASDVTRRNELLVGGRRADPLRMPASVPDAERPVSSPLRRMKSIMFQGAPARRSARGWWHPITGGTHCWRCIARRALSVHRSPGLLYCRLRATWRRLAIDPVPANTRTDGLVSHVANEPDIAPETDVYQ